MSHTERPIAYAQAMPRRSRPTEDFGPRLRRLRHERGWIQDELARQAQTTKRAINYYETAAKYPPAPALAALAAALGVTMETLMGQHDVPDPKHGDALNLLGDPEDRRLWKKFRQLRNLSERDQAAIFRMVNMMTEAKDFSKSA